MTALWFESPVADAWAAFSTVVVAGIVAISARVAVGYRESAE